MAEKSSKIIIGRRDKVDFPDLNLLDIDAQVETGTYLSSLNCKDIEVAIEDEEKKVRFFLIDPIHPSYNERLYTLPIYKLRKVKDANGRAQNLYSIFTPILLFELHFEIEIELTHDPEREYPLVLGRKFISKRFLVDVNKYDLSHKQKLKKQKFS